MLAQFQAPRRQARDSAPGCDGIPGALLRANPSTTAEYYYPLQLKFSLSLVKPVQWRGVFCRALIQSGQPDPTKCSSSRTISVSSQIGKASKRCLRKALLPQLDDDAGETQSVGLPGQGAARASLLVRVAQSIAKARRLSFGALFLDVVQAFYRAIRELVIQAHRDTALDDETIAALVRASGLPP
eukprot:1971287-Pyramimonas_sp.AAC.1